MRNEPEGWAIMEKYNRMDVVLTEKLYNKLIPWISSHPNHNLYGDGTASVCTNCGSEHLHSKGQVYTNAGIYKRFKCVECGTNMRGRSTQVAKESRENLVLGVI